MHLVRWEPFADLRQVMDRAFEDDLRPSLWRGITSQPLMPLDMYQTADEVVVKATIPGIDPDDVDITIAGDVLTIKAETKAEEENKDADYFYRERRYGASTRTVSLPADLQSDKAEASFENGVLTLSIPKAEEVKPKQIKVKAKGVIDSK